MAVRCKHRVRIPGGMMPRYRDCRFDATRDGYCGYHHPDKDKQRREASQARWDAHYKKGRDEHEQRLKDRVDARRYRWLREHFAEFEMRNPGQAKFMIETAEELDSICDENSGENHGP